MMSQGDLDREVESVIKAAINKGDVLPVTWLTQAIVATHKDISGADADWYAVCGYGHVRAMVRAAVRRFKPDAESEVDRNLILPGFERVQTAYVVERDGEQNFVPTGQLTNDEIETKAVELEQMGAGCFLHAKELRRYKAERSRVAA
jgi:hypothetical protein